MASDRQWSGMMSRTARRVANNLGIISGDQVSSSKLKIRSPKLDQLDSYYENTQYDDLIPWEHAAALKGDEYIPVRKRKPRIIYAFPKMLCQRVASKIVGQNQFPTLIIEDDPDAQMFIQMVVKISKLPSKLLEPVRRTLASGSGLVRFYFINGTIQVESYLGKYCYPEFDEAGELNFVRIQYVYEDPSDKDQNGTPQQKWYRLDLSQNSDILYDTPDYKSGVEPQFEVVSTVQHDLGFVQAEWLRTCEEKHSPDGYSLISDIMNFVDDINYSLSQSSVAVSYNQDPQLTIKGMDTDEVEQLIKSSAKAWELGRDGEAKFLESNLGGVERATELRDKMKSGIQDIARVVMLDPEKIIGSAQSGKAMEILHGPLVELINELRPVFEQNIINLTLKIAITMLMLKSQGAEVGMEMPPGWAPQSLNITAQWPSIFPMTMNDLLDKLKVATTATSANLVSRETMTRWIAKDFAIEDVDGEIAKINSQPVLNPFGGGF